MRLRVLSPVHVGDGGRISRWEYVPKNGFVDVLSPEILIETLYSRIVHRDRLRNALLDLRNRIREGRGSVEDFIRDYNLQVEPVYRVRSEGRPVGEIWTVVKNPEGVYIPGTEIKGAIRTAFIYYALFKDLEKSQKRSLFVDLLRKVRQADSRREVEALHSWIEGRVLYPEDMGRRDPKYDLFKAFAVSDTETRPHEEVLEVRRVKLHGSSRRVEEFHELVREGSEFRFELGIEESVLKGLREEGKSWRFLDFMNLEFLKESCMKFYRDLLVEEITYFRRNNLREAEMFSEDLLKRIEEGSWLIRIGKHQGFLSTTVTLLIKRASKEIFAELYEKAVPRHSAEKPKTRWVDGRGIPLGWAEVLP